MNNKFGIYNKSYLLILGALKNFPEIKKAAIFGSRALGNFKKGSDIDLAIIGEKINDQTITKLSVQLNEELPIPYFVDILDYKNLENQNLKNHIDESGKIIYNKQ